MKGTPLVHHLRRWLALGAFALAVALAVFALAPASFRRRLMPAVETAGPSSVTLRPGSAAIVAESHSRQIAELYARLAVVESELATVRAAALPCADPTRKESRP